MSAARLSYDLDKTVEIIKRLLFLNNLNPSTLATEIGVSPSTVTRLVNNELQRPKERILALIADFFSLSIEQLKGIKEINWQEMSSLLDFYQDRRVPLYSWSYADHWIHLSDTDNNKLFITTDLKDLSQQAFALRIKDKKMEPMFPVNSVIICDPDKEYKDGSFVLVKIHDLDEIVFRKLYLDMGQKYLFPLNNEIGNITGKAINDADEILGVVVQCKFDL